MKLKECNNSSNIIFLLPLAIIVGIVPLIVFAKKILVTGVVAYTWKKEFDFFSYYKMVFLLSATVLGMLSFGFYLKKREKVKRSYYYLFLEIYAIFIILSTVYAEATKVALWGFPDRYEGMFVLLSYLIVLFLTINLVDYKKDFDFLLGTIFVSSVIICIVGIFQYLGHDILTSAFGEKLIVPHNLVGYLNNLNPKFDYIFSTFYNPNYVGSYTGMLLSLLIGLYILIKEKKMKIVIGFFTLLIFSNWMGCLSRAGMVGGTFAIILLLSLLDKKVLLKNKNEILALSLGIIIIFITMNYLGDGRLVRELISFNKEVQKDSGELKDIKINDGILTISTEKSILKLKSPNKGELELFNQDNKSISYNLDRKTGEISFVDDEYQGYRLKFTSKTDVIHLNYRNKDIDFKIMTENNKRDFLIIGFMERGYKPLKIEKWWFENHEGFASHRGYIWSRSIPLLKNTIFTGYGPDTYALYFPQFDAVGKLINFGTPKVIVDKPHNMYLQIAINTGVLSLLTVLAMFMMYIIESFKLYWRCGFNDYYQQVGVSIFVGIVAYLIAGLFNDSVVSVAPVFWSLFGMGISVNHKLKNQS